jgi:hypothetical protein
MLNLLLQTEVPERVGEVLDAAKEDPVLAGILLAIGVATLAIFLWGLVKQVFKAAIFGGVASAIVWFWYFDVR